MLNHLASTASPQTSLILQTDLHLYFSESLAEQSAAKAIFTATTRTRPLRLLQTTKPEMIDLPGAETISQT